MRSFAFLSKALRTGGETIRSWTGAFLLFGVFGGTTGLPLLAQSDVGTAAGKNVYFLRNSVFRIPIQVHASKLSQIKELRLFESNDRGATWRLSATAQPEERFFSFSHRADGEYWFTLVKVDKKGRPTPAEVEGGPADMKLIVDTTAPQVDLRALPTSGDKVGVSWHVADPDLDLNSLTLEVRSADEDVWRTIETAKQRSGQWEWPAVAEGSYSAKLSVKDMAGNVQVSRLEIAAREAVAVSPAPEDLRWAANQKIADTAVGADERRSAIADPSTPRPHDLEDVASAPAPDGFDPNAPLVRPAQHTELADGSRSDDGVVPATTNKQPIASTNKPVIQVSAQMPTPNSNPDLKRIPLIATTRFAVNYSLRGVGPAGVGRVELYYTKDNGANWILYGEDADKAPPFEVTMPGEGRYGMKVVVTSPAGYGQKPPKPGDIPHMIVEVDTTAPQAELYQPRPDPASSLDSLLITWSAFDPHIIGRPVSLFYSESPNGEWRPIMENLPAIGEYSWKVPKDTPYKVYLRLVARDLGNNISIADTPEPVLVDLSRPEGYIDGIENIATPQMGNAYR